MTRKLYRAQRRAHAVSRGALTVFEKIAGDLRRAADAHVAVGNEATEKINELSELRHSADALAAAAFAKADKIEALLK